MKIIFSLLVLTLFSSSLFAAPYIIKGNEKTSTRYIERLLKKCEKEQTNTSNLNELEQCLLNTRLFSEVHITQEKEGTQVEIKDRWSIIPFPSLKMSSGGEKSFGLLVFDANFLGTGTLLGLGGSYSSSKSSYVLFYQDKSFLLTDWSLGFSTGKNNADIYWKNKNLKEIDAFHEKTQYNSLSLGYSFTNNFQLESSFIRRFTSYESIQGYNLPQEFHSNLVRLEATYTKEEYKFYFSKGYHLIAAIDQEFDRSDSSEKIRILNLNLMTGQETIHKQALLTSFNLVTVDGGDKRDALKQGRHQSYGKGLRGIPEGGYFTHFIATASADYQIPLRFAKYGTWTLAPFIDLGKISGYEKQNEDLWQRAYGVGTYFFLTGVMLPGVGFVAGRNETFKSVFAELSVGESF